MLVRTMKEKERGGLRAAAFAAGVALAYVVARHFIYAAMPIETFGEWFWRDLQMSVPRVLGLTACLLYAARNGGLQAWGWTWKWSAAGALVLLLPTAMEIAAHLGRGTTHELPPWMLGAGWLATGAVAVFEEAAFRSLMYRGLRRRLSPLAAGVLSALAFAVFHIEVQPVASWAHLVAYGLATCAALELGLGLWWLVAAHWLVDGVWYHLSSGAGIPAAGYAFHALIVVTTLVSLAVLRRRGAGGAAPLGRSSLALLDYPR